MCSKLAESHDLDSNTAIIIGASGGLGVGFTKILAVDAAFQSRYSQILGFSRQPAANHPQTIDYADESTIARSAAWAAEQCQTSPLRLLIVATGYLHSNGQGPERSLQHLNADYLQRVMLVNAIGPALVLKYFAPLMPKTGDMRLAFVSAKVGSISDNSLGGWYSYRSAKAALNMLVKNLSIEVGRLNKTAAIVSIHPGTTDTELSAPFQQNLPARQLQSPDATAQRLANVAAELSAERTGFLLNWDGSTLPW